VFDDVDETLRQVLLTDVPIDRNEIDIAFDRPTREWTSRLSRPTLNLFLFDVRERIDFRDDAVRVSRSPNGQALHERPPRRVDLSYMVTAWTKDVGDEHRLLAGVLACTYRQGRVDPKLLQGALVGSDVPLLVRSMPPDYLVKPTDYWGVVDNDLHASLTWVATAPLDAFRTFTGPLVRTRELLVGELGADGRDVFVLVAGVAHRKGESTAGIAAARVTVAGTGLEALTDREGKFTFPRISHGDYTWRVETPDGKAVDRKITVPSASYDVEID
jgi:hypothetical protein